MKDGYEEAVSYRDGHLQIIACAGAGKTETIARRVASLLAEGIDPAGIIAFTFTEKAGRELKSRIELKVTEWDGLGPAMLDKLGPMYVGTIHAFCMQILQRFTPEMAAFDVLDEHKLMGLLSREYSVLQLEDLGGGGHRQNIELFRRSVDVVENELLDPSQLGETSFASSYVRYLDMLDRYQALTYGQMIVCAVQAVAAGDAASDAVLICRAICQAPHDHEPRPRGSWSSFCRRSGERARPVATRGQR